jgi:hypothetical protein
LAIQTTKKKSSRLSVANETEKEELQADSKERRNEIGLQRPGYSLNPPSSCPGAGNFVVFAKTAFFFERTRKCKQKHPLMSSSHGASDIE